MKHTLPLRPRQLASQPCCVQTVPQRLQHFYRQRRVLEPHRADYTTPCMGRRLQAVLKASTSSSGDSFTQTTDVTTGGGGGGGGGFDILTAVAGLTLWAGSVGYAFSLSPNQTPYRDMYFLEKLTGLGENDGVQVNAVFTAICLMMGVWPCIYSAFLIPSARSGNKVPAWPFVMLSFAFGVFALGPYFALWKPSREAQSPPAQEELRGWRNLGLKATESKAAGWLLLASNLILLGQAAFAGGESWTEYFQLFRESRFVHVTSLDFTALCLFAPFWMWNDADKRQWQGRLSGLTPVFNIGAATASGSFFQSFPAYHFWDQLSTSR